MGKVCMYEKKKTSRYGFVDYVRPLFGHNVTRFYNSDGSKCIKRK